jgi:DNA-binding NarL/FixJ family response regulator
VLPRALLEHFLHGEERVVGRTLVVRRQVEHRLLFLRARLRCRADALTVRERSVADLIAQGGTHKEVARRLSRAPATIRNQLQSIYAKLEVANVAGLIEALKLAD